MEGKKSNKPLFIWIVALVFSLCVCMGIFFIFSSRERREKTLGLARRLFEKPVRIQMEKPKKDDAKFIDRKDGICYNVENRIIFWKTEL